MSDDLRQVAELPSGRRLFARRTEGGGIQYFTELEGIDFVQMFDTTLVALSDVRVVLAIHSDVDRLIDHLPVFGGQQCLMT